MSGSASHVPDAIDGMDDLAKCIRWFEDSEQVTQDARRLAERDRDFYDNIQLSAEELATLKKRRQPPHINNYVQRKIDHLLGVERQGRSDPKAYPRTPNEDTRADAATQALRYISDENRFDVTRSAVNKNMLIEGFGGAEVVVEPRSDRDGYNIKFNQIPWERLFYDPHSQNSGFTDASYLGVVIWMDRDAALEKYPGTDAILDASFSIGASQTYDDKPKWFGSWVDSRRTRVRVVQIHWKRGVDWWVGTFTRGGWLEEPMVSPYIDRHGNRSCPLILRSSYIDRENNRYGVVRSMVPLQEAINKRESKLLHLLNVNQIVMEDGAVDDVDKARAEAAKPDGVLVHNKGFEFEIKRDQSEVQGHFQLLQYAVSQMNVAGPNAAMSGKDPREQSGRAILAQQAGGMVEHEPLADELRQWTHKMFEAAWMRVRQFWTSEEWVRVTDNDKNVQFIGLNHPVTLADELSHIDPNTPLQVQLSKMNPQIAQLIMLAQHLPPDDPRLQTVVRIENDVDDMDVDITVEEATDTPSMAIEQWQAFIQLPAPVLQQMPLALFIKMNPGLKDKDQYLKLLDQHQEQQAQAAQPQHQAQQAMQQAQLAKAQADAADKNAQAKDRTAQTLERMHGLATDHAFMTTPPTNGLMPAAQTAPPTPTGVYP